MAESSVLYYIIFCIGYCFYLFLYSSYISGIRPGRETAEYLQGVINKLLIVGSTFLGLIAIMPFVVQVFLQSDVLRIGGTSLLIVVSVVIEMIKQINAQLVMRDYEAF